jgi:hypothetical protein
VFLKELRAHDHSVISVTKSTPHSSSRLSFGLPSSCDIVSSKLHFKSCSTLTVVDEAEMDDMSDHPTDEGSTEALLYELDEWAAEQPILANQ